MISSLRVGIRGLEEEVAAGGFSFGAPAGQTSFSGGISQRSRQKDGGGVLFGTQQKGQQEMQQQQQQEQAIQSEGLSFEIRQKKKQQQQPQQPIQYVVESSFGIQQEQGEQEKKQQQLQRKSFRSYAALPQGKTTHVVPDDLPPPRPPRKPRKSANLGAAPPPSGIIREQQLTCDVPQIPPRHRRPVVSTASLLSRSIICEQERITYDDLPPHEPAIRRMTLSLSSKVHEPPTYPLTDITQPTYDVVPINYLPTSYDACPSPPHEELYEELYDVPEYSVLTSSKNAPPPPPQLPSLPRESTMVRTKSFPAGKVMSELLVKRGRCHTRGNY